VVNVAVYGGPRITPPATIAMSAPPKLVPGQNTVVRLVVKNTLPTPISQVVVTDLFPAGLTPVEVKIADGSGAAQIVDAGDKGQLVFVNLGSLPAGGVENILITVAVAKNFAAAPVKNTATLFYRESAADQVTMEFNSGATGSENEVAPAAVPETATPVPTVAATAVPAQTPTLTAPVEVTPTVTISEEITVAAETAAEISATVETTATVEAIATVPPAETPAAQADDSFIPPSGLPTTGDDFVPPPGVLPATGEDLYAVPASLPNTGVSPFLPVSGLGLAVVAIALHQLRAWRRNKN
jgi:uncharacterized repeat protein (TIGR01451 family)